MDMQQKRGVSPITLFYSYAHEDELLRNELEKHLSLLHRQGLISEWHDRQILPGDEWAHDIDAHLEMASIILLLISPDFLASDYCYDIEMQRALERHKSREARVIPIILRPCDWYSAPFGHLQYLPHNGKAVTTWQDKDEAFLTIAQGLRRIIERQQIPAPPLSRMERQNRTRLIQRVRSTWIEGVLEHSLHQAALIVLDLQEQPDALANPWRLEVQETNLPPRLLPTGTTLVQVYDEAEGELLILGEPGAGKTTLLLHLASDLLKRAEQETSFPMPVIFTLSSWAQKRLSLADWFIEELFTKYQVPRKLGRSWVGNNQLLLLLDGLDEVALAHRSACIQAINAYRQAHNLVPVVLCSRKAEYEAQSNRVNLSKAVVIRPLTSQQIDDYLTQAGSQLEAIRSLLHEDQELQELATTPLMLTILALAYQGKTVADLATPMPPDVQRRRVLATYVERMLQRRAVSRYTPEQTKYWLSWLARQMVQRGQAEFYLEQMQPSQLTGNQELPFHRGYNIKLKGGLFFGLFFGLLSWFIQTAVLSLFINFHDAPTLALHGAYILSLFFGLFFTRSLGIFDIGNTKTLLESSPWSLGSIWRRIGTSLSYALAGGLIYVVVIVLMPNIPRTLTFYLTVGIGTTLVFWICFVLDPGIREIQPVENLTWSWREVWRRLPFSLSLGFILTISFYILGVLAAAGGEVLSRQVIEGIIAWLVILLVSGLSGNILDKSTRIRPNEGILRSRRNSVQVMLFVCLSVGLGIGVINDNLITGLAAGLFFGLYFGLLSGGRAYLLHLTLRFLLWRNGFIPLDYPHFLDYAAERILLRKVGGGYVFLHRLLLDYFASLKTSPSKEHP